MIPTETPLTALFVFCFFFILGLLGAVLEEHKAERNKKETSDQIDQPRLNPDYGAYIWLSVRR